MAHPPFRVTRHFRRVRTATPDMTARSNSRPTLFWGKFFCAKIVDRTEAEGAEEYREGDALTQFCRKRGIVIHKARIFRIPPKTFCRNEKGLSKWGKAPDNFFSNKYLQPPYMGLE